MIPTSVYELYQKVRPRYFRRVIHTGVFNKFYMTFSLDDEMFYIFNKIKTSDRPRFVIDNFNKIQDIYDNQSKGYYERNFCDLKFTNVMALSSFVAALADLVRARK